MPGEEQNNQAKNEYQQQTKIKQSKTH